jgi:hypothetical protein
MKTDRHGSVASPDIVDCTVGLSHSPLHPWQVGSKIRMVCDQVEVISIAVWPQTCIRSPKQLAKTWFLGHINGRARNERAAPIQAVNQSIGLILLNAMDECGGEIRAH